MTQYSGKGVTPDAWEYLKQYTSARIAIGRSGGSLPTSEWLRFKLDHARARDAVHLDFDALDLAERVRAAGAETLVIKTLASDRMTYLQRPDLGRRLNDESKMHLNRLSGDYDLVLVVSDGLSSMAVERHALPLLEVLLPKLHSLQWKLAPTVIAPFARVALEDEIGALLNAQIALILLGERPGLGSPDSLGAYLVFNPRCGNTDARRNCVSNIRPEGLDYRAAADTLEYLLVRARIGRLSGVLLKDDRKVSDVTVTRHESPAVLPGTD
ncbi:MAG: ethanolamine ammonia-lyase subunit EutC [Methylococcales bacterium]